MVQSASRTLLQPLQVVQFITMTHSWQCSSWQLTVSCVFLAHGALQFFIVPLLILINRKQDYFRIRSPFVLAFYCAYACLIQVVVAVQEITICLGYEWPGFVFWLMSMLYVPIIGSLPAIRGLSVMVRFSPHLRLTPNVRFLHTRHNIRYFGFSFSLSVIVFLVLLGIFPQYRSMNVGRWASINREWYLFLPYSIYWQFTARALGQSLKKVDDLFGAAGETHRAYFALALFPIPYYVMECVADYAVPVFGNCHIITTSIDTGNGGVQCLEQVALPLQFFFAFGMAVYVHLLTTRPLYHWYTYWRYMIIDRIARFNEHELSSNEADQFMSASRNNAFYIGKESWTLERVLNDKKAFELFERHAQRAFSAECVAFWTKYNHFLAMKNDIDKQSNQPSAFSLGPVSLLRANSDGYQNADSRITLPQTPLTGIDELEKSMLHNATKSDDCPLVSEDIIAPLPVKQRVSSNGNLNSNANLLVLTPNRLSRIRSPSTPVQLTSPTVCKRIEQNSMLLHTQSLKCRVVRFAITVLFKDFIKKDAPFELNIADSISGKMSALVSRVVDSFPWSAVPDSVDESKTSMVVGSTMIPVSTLRPTTTKLQIQPSLMKLLWGRAVRRLFGSLGVFPSAAPLQDKDAPVLSTMLTLSDEEAELLDDYIQELTVLLNRIATDIKNLMQTNLWMSFVNSNEFIELSKINASLRPERI